MKPMIIGLSFFLTGAVMVSTAMIMIQQYY